MAGALGKLMQLKCGIMLLQGYKKKVKVVIIIGGGLKPIRGNFRARCVDAFQGPKMLPCMQRSE